MARAWRTWALALASCSMPVAGAWAFESMAFSVLGPEGRATLRWVGQEASCPAVHWQGQADAPALQLRVAAQQTSPVKGASRAVDFPVRVCEAAWPAGVRHATVRGQTLQLPGAIRRVLIVADTGCRMKASENAFQECNDPQQWPFAAIADAAARQQPDLVLHIGDIHYRESPCPPGRAGCAGSPSGYGWAAWQADFFTPARRLLQAAPWLMVRGNHESCARAGQGWFRFLDSGPWQPQRSCMDPADDALAAHSQPFAVPVGSAGSADSGASAQFIVFDSSVATGQALGQDEPMFQRYMQDLRDVQTLAARAPSVFLSHHPLLVAMTDASGRPRAAGNATLLSVAQAGWGQALFPANVDWTMHGHIHVFESLSFRGTHPASLILGTGGTAMEKAPPQRLPAGMTLAPGAEPDAYMGQARFGFSMLEIAQTPQQPWTLTHYDTAGQVMLTCQLTPRQSHCQRAP